MNATNSFAFVTTVATICLSDIQRDGVPSNFLNADILGTIINSSILNILGNIGSTPIKYHILFLSDQTNHAVLVTNYR